MGLIDTFKKEILVNKLATSFKLVYDCGDMAAIECLRQNYSRMELKEIYHLLKEAEKQGNLSLAISLTRPFKEEYEEVEEINRRLSGN